MSFAYIPPTKVNTCSTLQRSLRSRDMIKATKTVNFSWQRLGIFSAFTHVFLKSPIPANSLTTKKLTVKEYSISRGEKLEGVFNFSISSPEWKQLRLLYNVNSYRHQGYWREVFFRTLSFSSGHLISRGFYFWGNEPGGFMVIEGRHIHNIPQVKNRRINVHHMDQQIHQLSNEQLQ